MVKICASQSWGPRFDSRPGRGLNIWVTFFPAKVHSAFHPPGVGKMSTSIRGLIWSGCQRRQYVLPVRWGKLIIVKRLWACYMEKALYKCTTLLYFITSKHAWLAFHSRFLGMVEFCPPGGGMGTPYIRMIVVFFRGWNRRFNVF